MATQPATPRPGDSNALQAREAPIRLALRREEAAEALAMSVDTFDERVRPHVRAIRLGRRRVYPIPELERWLEASAEAVIDR